MVSESVIPKIKNDFKNKIIKLYKKNTRHIVFCISHQINKDKVQPY